MLLSATLLSQVSTNDTSKPAAVCCHITIASLGPAKCGRSPAGDSLAPGQAWGCRAAGGRDSRAGHLLSALSTGRFAAILPAVLGEVLPTLLHFTTFP